MAHNSTFYWDPDVLGRQAPGQSSRGDYESAYGEQKRFAGSYYDALKGGKESYGEAMLAKGQQQAMRGMQSQAISRGANPATERAAIMQGGQMATQNAANAAAIRAQEMQQARMAMLGTLQQGTQGELSWAELRAQQEQARAQYELGMGQQSLMERGQNIQAVGVGLGAAGAMGGAMFSGEECKQNAQAYTGASQDLLASSLAMDPSGGVGTKPVGVRQPGIDVAEGPSAEAPPVMSPEQQAAANAHYVRDWEVSQPEHTPTSPRPPVGAADVVYVPTPEVSVSAAAPAGPGAMNRRRERAVDEYNAEREQEYLMGRQGQTSVAYGDPNSDFIHDYRPEPTLARPETSYGEVFGGPGEPGYAEARELQAEERRRRESDNYWSDPRLKSAIAQAGPAVQDAIAVNLASQVNPGGAEAFGPRTVYTGTQAASERLPVSQQRGAGYGRSTMYAPLQTARGGLLSGPAERGAVALRMRPTEADEQADDLELMRFRYKDIARQRGAPAGQRVGVMTSQLKDTPAGRSAIVQTPIGEGLDRDNALGLSLGLHGRTAERLDELERRLAAKGK